MSHRNKRRQELDPTASDPEDLDWGQESPPRPQKRRSKPSSSAKRRPNKRQRRGYHDSDDEIVDDEDEINDDSFASEASEEEIAINPNTGRSVRRAAQKNIKYEEPSDDEIEEATPEDDDDPAPTPKGKARPRKSLIIKIPMKRNIPPRATRARTGSRSLARGTTPEVTGARRSSRLSHDQEEPILALTDSGKHTVVIRPGTRSPEPQSARHTRGGKGMKTLPSAIMEASQENSGPSMEHQDTPGPLDDIIDDIIADNAQVQASEPGSRAGSETQVQVDEDVQMDAVIQESDHEGEAEDTDEGPVTRGGRNLRVSSPPVA